MKDIWPLFSAEKKVNVNELGQHPRDPRIYD